MAYQDYVYENVFLQKEFELVLEEEEYDGDEGGDGGYFGGSSPSPLLSCFEYSP